MSVHAKEFVAIAGDVISAKKLDEAVRDAPVSKDAVQNVLTLSQGLVKEFRAIAVVEQAATALEKTKPELAQQVRQIALSAAPQ